MKGLKKLTLASAIAVAPFASQAMEALDDATMGDVTGQAGVTIEIGIQDTGISVGEIEYKDEGSVLIKDVSVSGWDPTANGGLGGPSAVTITQEVDVLADGSLQMVNSTAAGQQLRLQVGSVELQSETDSTTNSELVAGVDMKVELGTTSTTTIHNVDIGTQTLGDFGVTGSYAAGTSGLVINAQAAVRIADLDVGLFGYTDTQAAAIASQRANAAGFTGTDDTVTATGTVFADADAAGDNDGFIDAAEVTAYQNGVAAGSAIQANDITFDNGSGGVVTVSQKVWADSTGVYIQLGNIAGDLTIGETVIGGNSIGEISVRNINLAGLTQKIYGHP